jgi:hypothetical protein
MVRSFAEDPLRYIAPYAYLQNPQSFVAPALRVAGTPPFGFQWTSAGDGRIVEWSTDKQDILSLIEPLPISRHTFIRPEDAIENSSMLKIGDYLFSEKARYADDRQRTGRVFLQDSGFSAIELLI